MASERTMLPRWWSSSGWRTDRPTDAARAGGCVDCEAPVAAGRRRCARCYSRAAQRILRARGRTASERGA